MAYNVANTAIATGLRWVLVWLPGGEAVLRRWRVVSCRWLAQWTGLGGGA